MARDELLDVFYSPAWDEVFLLTKKNRVICFNFDSQEWVEYEKSAIPELTKVKQEFISAGLLVARWGCTWEALDAMIKVYLQQASFRDTEKRHKNAEGSRTKKEEAALFYEMRIFRAPGIDLEEEELF